MTTVPVCEVSTDEWVDRAKAIAPVLEQHRTDSEQQRHMAQPIFDAIREKHYRHVRPASVRRAAGGAARESAGDRGDLRRGRLRWLDAMIWTGTGLFADDLAQDVVRDYRRWQ